MIDLPIRTERAIIRRFEPQDLKPFLEFMLDPDSTRYLFFEQSRKTVQGAIALFDLVRSSYDADAPVHSYAIADRRTNAYLGSCGFAEYDAGIVEVYYSINRAHARHGLATEVTRELARILSQTHEVRAYCSPANPAAHAVAVNSGFEARGRAIHRHFAVERMLFVYPHQGVPAQ